MRHLSMSVLFLLMALMFLTLKAGWEATAATYDCSAWGSMMGGVPPVVLDLFERAFELHLLGTMLNTGIGSALIAGAIGYTASLVLDKFDQARVIRPMVTGFLVRCSIVWLFVSIVALSQSNYGHYRLVTLFRHTWFDFTVQYIVEIVGGYALVDITVQLIMKLYPTFWSSKAKTSSQPSVALEE